MSNDDFAPTMPKNRKRPLERLDQMVQSGQVRPEEATDVRSATNALTTRQRSSGSEPGTRGCASTPRSRLDR